MKKWFFYLIILLLFAYGAIKHQPNNMAEKTPAEDHQSAQEEPRQSNEHTITVTKDQVYKGNLLLVNKDHPVPQEGGPSEAVYLFQHKKLVKGFGLLVETIQLSPSLAKNLQRWLKPRLGTEFNIS
jgi:D-alanyl-D-alanine carboxypeptidase